MFFVMRDYSSQSIEAQNPLIYIPEVSTAVGYRAVLRFSIFHSTDIDTAVAAE